MEKTNSSSTAMPYTCVTCRVAFKDLEIQRQHYKTDWHRYNLKRKVAELPPVTAEDFKVKVLAQKGEFTDINDVTTNCKICKKIFNSKNQYDNHLMSKKHKDKCQLKTIDDAISDAIDDEVVNNPSSTNLVEKIVEKKVNEMTLTDMELDSDTETLDSDEWYEDTENPAKNNDCLFCNHHSKSLVKNLKHMTEAHSFFIPDPEYCVDLKGLVEYLGEKIFAGFMCIWCNETGRAFQSAEAARAHMIDKGHCKMLHEGETLAEYAEFYDYSTSYPDAGDQDPDAEVEIPELDDGDYQLVLPSGSVIGHRSLMIYYKQNLNPNSAFAVSKSDKLRRVLSHYRAIGWTETQKEIVARKARDIKYMQRVQAKYSTQLQFKANKLQTHFRQQVNF